MSGGNILVQDSENKYLSSICLFAFSTFRFDRKSDAGVVQS